MTVKSKITTMDICNFPIELVRLAALFGIAIACFSMLVSNDNSQLLNNNNNNRGSLIQFAECTNTNTSATNGKAYWHRPGCFQVGHTRTISIPGCVKFNLSTNACRGFCMSFSIPLNEDIGPAPPSSTPNELASDQMTTTTTATTPSMTNAALYQQIAQTNLNEGNPNNRRLAGGGGADGTDTAELPPNLLELAHFGGAQKSPLWGTIGNLNDKSDVVSVSQCCNMMETEDVTVNLRCGLNETRKLVFKSAKTCECFFCKHV